VSYHVNMADFAQVAAVTREVFAPDRLPAWTAVGVTGLASAGALLEIKATAVVAGQVKDQAQPR
jgi:enamine deaminase RidA (YjgF/YER057c/UK114 family)